MKIPSIVFLQSGTWVLSSVLTGAFLPMSILAAPLPGIPSENSPSSLPLVNGAMGAENHPMAQMNSVSQLRDVFPGDWAYQALSELMTRYNCLVGYPDGTFRGQRSLSRYEFAAGLNACLQSIERLLGDDDRPTQGDLEVLRRLEQEFSSELAFLGTRIDGLEARVAQLEEQQFSTTTKLFGQAIIGLQGRNNNQLDFFPVDGIADLRDPFTQPTVITNVQLSLFTQFSPRSLLLTGLQASNGRFRLTNDTALSYEGDFNNQNQFQLSDLTYRHLFGDRLALIVGPRGVNGVSVFRGANRVESAGFGPVSAFAQRNPIIAIGGGQGGLGLDWQVSDRLNVQGFYSSSLPNNGEFGGLLGGDFGDITSGVQVAIAPSNNLDLTLNYLYNYSPLGSLRTGIGEDQLVPEGTPLNTHAFGINLSWDATSWLNWGGWFGYTTSSIPSESGTVNTVNWMTFLNFPDLGGQGNLGGIYFGQPPKITRSTLPTGFNLPNLLAGGLGTSGGSRSTTTHLEAFYRWQMTDNIALTPGVVFVLNPAQSSGSDTITIGVLRTTFSF
ncbi:iron uptake porin [Spirulina subsalsa]|nr:iron uptake porin [Spirulina subsalsa]